MTDSLGAMVTVLVVVLARWKSLGRVLQMRRVLVMACLMRMLAAVVIVSSAVNVKNGFWWQPALPWSLSLCHLSKASNAMVL